MIPSKPEIKQLTLSELSPTQGDLKIRTTKDAEKLAKSFLENGNNYPLYAAFIDGKYQLLDGHFRREVLIREYGDDYTVDVLVLYGLTLAEAKKQCLVLSATYGTITDLRTWLSEELPNKEIDLDALNFKVSNADFDAALKRAADAPEKEYCPYCGNVKD